VNSAVTVESGVFADSPSLTEGSHGTDCAKGKKLKTEPKKILK
jgi:hypothetical protein